MFQPFFRLPPSRYAFSSVPAARRKTLQIKYSVKKRKRILSTGESVEGRRENIRSCYFITQITLIWEFFISRALNHSRMFSFGFKSDSGRLRRSAECQHKHFLVHRNFRDEKSHLSLCGKCFFPECCETQRRRVREATALLRVFQGLHEKLLVMNIAPVANENPPPSPLFVNIHNKVRSRLRKFQSMASILCCCFTCSHLRSKALKEIKTFLSVFIVARSTRQGWQKDCAENVLEQIFVFVPVPLAWAGRAVWHLCNVVYLRRSWWAHSITEQTSIDGDPGRGGSEIKLNTLSRFRFMFPEMIYANWRFLDIALKFS